MPDYCQCERSKRYFEEVRCCFICLNPNHMSKNCMSTMNCRHCNHKHHQSICEAVHNKNANRTRNLRMKQPMQRNLIVLQPQVQLVQGRTELFFYKLLEQWLSTRKIIDPFQFGFCLIVVASEAMSPTVRARLGLNLSKRIN